MELKDRVALVTGGAVRVGRAIVDELARGGACLALHYYHHEMKAELLRKDLTGRGLRVFPVRANLAAAHEVTQMFEAVDREFGRLDILVNNAAIFKRTPFPDLSDADWDQHIDINLKGTFLCCREAARRMIAQGEGKIVNIADVFGDRPWPAYIPYCVSKAGVVTLTKAIARAVAKHNIQVNAIGPGAILFPDDYSFEQIAEALDKVPSGRQGAPEDIARTVRFLIEGPDYITGALIPVDGGSSLT